MNSPVTQAYGKVYMEKPSFDIKPFIRLFAILNLLFTIGLFITSLMTTSYAGYYGFYLPASDSNEIHLGKCFYFLSRKRILKRNTTTQSSIRTKADKWPIGAKCTTELWDYWWICCTEHCSINMKNDSTIYSCFHDIFLIRGLRLK